jgi:hypothetical protein
MCKKIEGTIEYKVGTVSLSVASLVFASANIEQIPTSTSYYFKEAIYFMGKKQKSGGGYEADGVRVLMSTIELKALSYAMKEFIKLPIVDGNKRSDYDKISNSGVMKKIYLGFTQSITINDTSTPKVMPDVYHINIKLFGNQPSTTTVSVDKYKFLAFADSLFALAQEVEQTMFLYERGKDKQIRAQKAQEAKEIEDAKKAS